MPDDETVCGETEADVARQQVKILERRVAELEAALKKKTAECFEYRQRAANDLADAVDPMTLSVPLEAILAYAGHVELRNVRAEKAEAALEGKTAREWTCPACAFTCDAVHVSPPNTECPACEGLRLHAALAEKTAECDGWRAKSGSGEFAGDLNAARDEIRRLNLELKVAWSDCGGGTAACRACSQCFDAAERRAAETDRALAESQAREAKLREALREALREIALLDNKWAAKKRREIVAAARALPADSSALREVCEQVANFMFADCPGCDGSGLVADPPGKKDCKTCDGVGRPLPGPIVARVLGGAAK